LGAELRKDCARLSVIHPTPGALKADLREIGRKGFRAAMEESLPALSMLPSIERAAIAGRSQRDIEIERLLHAALEHLEEQLADAGTQYLFGRQDHKTRMELAGDVLSITDRSFARVRHKKLEPLLARALLNIAEGEHGRGQGAAVKPTTAHDDEPPFDELFPACLEGEEFKDRELEVIASRDASVWWHEASSKWFGSYFAFWCKDGTRPCEDVRYVLDQGSYGAARFDQEPSLDAEKDKLTIVSASWFSTDADVDEIYCGVTNYGFALRWAKDHADDLLNSRPSPSVFGATDRLAYPGIAGVHTLVQTSDGYLLFGLRGLKTVEYYQLMWSASYEETVLPRVRDGGGDETVLDTLVRGLREEWGIPASAVGASTTLAVGREFVRSDQGRLDLGTPILAAIRLGVDLTTVWKYLDRRLKIPDIDEHCAWAGVRFRSQADVLQLLSFTRDRTHGYDLLPEFASSFPSSSEIIFYPGSRDTCVEDRGLMPTSAARLYLGSQWLAEY
jgi:hypothetical protein